MKRIFACSVLLLFMLGYTEPLSPVIQWVNKDLASAKTKVTCADRSRLQSQCEKAHDCSVFWQSGTDANASFISADAKTGIVSVCDKGTVVAAVIDSEFTNPDFTEIGVMSVNDFDPSNKSKQGKPFFHDWNNDGKTEFLAYTGQCAEGPCMGSHYLLQINGKKLRLLATIDAEIMDTVEENKLHGFAATQFCFDYDFGIKFSYFAILQWQDEKLQMIPYPSIRKDYPSYLKSTFSNTQKPSAIEKLISDAYNGKKISDITKAYEKLIKGKPDGLGVHCEPLEILKMISGEK